jgi:Tol biopolymer transport system component
VVDNAGIWSAPRYSPILPNRNIQYPQGYMAYLDARDLSNSINSTAEYDLYAADRDGSNARKIYPPDGQPGLSAQNFVWSPDGRQIAFIYQGNLWIVDVESKVSHQLTLDGGASQPVWMP